MSNNDNNNMDQQQQQEGTIIAIDEEGKDTGIECQGCKKVFASRNAIFRHLKDTNGACLSSDQHADFVKFVQNRDRTKVLLLYGYLPSREYLQLELPDVTITTDRHRQNENGAIRNGDDAAQILLEVLEQLTLGNDVNDDDNNNNDDLSNTNSSNKLALINRSYGCKARSAGCVAQDDGTGAITEVMTVKLPHLPSSNNNPTKVDAWIESVNQALDERLMNDTGRIRLLGRLDMSHKKFHAETDVTHRRVDYLLPADFFYHPNLSHVKSRQDYLDTFEPFGVGHNPYPNLNDSSDTPSSSAAGGVNIEISKIADSKRRNTIQYLHTIKKMMQRLTSHIVELDMEDASAVMEKDFHQQKRKRHRSHHPTTTTTTTPHGSKHAPKQPLSETTITTTTTLPPSTPLPAQEDENLVSEVASQEEQGQEPNNHDSQTQRSAIIASHESSTLSLTVPKKKSTQSRKGRNVLRRRRFHNFTPRLMAHEFLAYRRMDRLYHRATYRLPIPSPSSPPPPRLAADITQADCTPSYPFVLLSISGDMFLTGQACRVVGLLIALMRGMIDIDIIDCIFDEAFPHLVPAPPAPSLGLLASEASYMTWEGRSKLILSPRRCNRYSKGFCEESTLQKVEDWQIYLHEQVANAWMELGFDPDGRLTADRIWTETVLEPWAMRAREQLKEYRTWKLASANQDVTTTAAAVDVVTNEQTVVSDVLLPDPLLQSNSEHASVETSTTPAPLPLPCVSSTDVSTPPLYLKVLDCLRKADASGLWPTTTPKRQLVMVTTRKEGGESASGSSLLVAHIKAKQNKREESSAYAFVEGEGGASGSFSVGAMPGEQCLQPKGNQLFPELMKAAFELEIALCPNRPPSSTIAINRNAQFRPHTDSGAGAGQSTSLIVGLGDYVGGELVVEGQKMDIRYKPIEFNGWKQGHWTMPFQGERYSLVWFTPKGCEDVRGIDLCT